MVVTTYACIKNNASRSAFLYIVNNKRLGLLWFLTQVAQDVAALFIPYLTIFCWRAYFTATFWATCGSNTGGPRRSTQVAQDVAALFIPYSAGVLILLQRFGLLWFQHR